MIRTDANAGADMTRACLRCMTRACAGLLTKFELLVLSRECGNEPGNSLN